MTAKTEALELADRLTLAADKAEENGATAVTIEIAGLRKITAALSASPEAPGRPSDTCPDCLGNGKQCLAGHSAHPANWYTCETCGGTGKAPGREPVALWGIEVNGVIKSGQFHRSFAEKAAETYNNRGDGFTARIVPLYRASAEAPGRESRELLMDVISAMGGLQRLNKSNPALAVEANNFVMGGSAPKSPSGAGETFTPDQVENLFRYQLAGQMHPFTCPNRGDGKHRENGSDKGMLVPTVRGWMCPFCDYTQDWAHEFMTDGSAIRQLPEKEG